MENELETKNLIHEFEPEIRDTAIQASKIIVDRVTKFSSNIGMSDRQKNMIVFQIVNHMRNTLMMVINEDDNGIDQNFEKLMKFD